jgi:hypothetical protein
MESKRMIQRIDELTSWLFEEINETDQPLVKLTKIQDQMDSPLNSTRPLKKDQHPLKLFENKGIESLPSKHET